MMMQSKQSLGASQSHRHVAQSPAVPAKYKFSKQSRELRSQASKYTSLPSHAVQQEEDQQLLQRRSVFMATAGLGTALGLPLVLPTAACADTIPLVEFEDSVDKFKLGIPEGWVSAEGAIPTGANGTRRTLAWFPQGGSAKELNVSVTITNTSFEFTSLGSFGNAAAFSQNLVNSLDRSYLLREQERTGKPSKDPIQVDPAQADPIQLAKLVDYDSKRSMYYVEYTVQLLPQEPRHLFSAVALGNNGRYNRLYTCTAQCDESVVAENKALLQAVVNSFRSEVSAQAA